MALKQNISISDYTYELPDEKIAKHPLENRDESKLLVYNQGTISDDRFYNIADYLPHNSLLVYNNTRVIHARLPFYKQTGARIEIFCLEPVSPSDHQLMFSSTQKVTWKCMIGNLKKWKNETLVLQGERFPDGFTLEATLKERNGSNSLVEFCWNTSHTFSEVIEMSGVIPIPPYLNRETSEKDKEVYQTVYAKNEGSVAAPTAGLHFTNTVFDRINKKNIDRCEVTLHVGAGTFQPVKSDDVSEHDMHAEWISVSRQSIETLLNNLGNITAVGTTTVRTLESLYWLGCKINETTDLSPSELMVDQWEPYGNEKEVDKSDALNNILKYLNKNQITEVRFYTQIIIVPGYTFKIVDRIITNFHQPSSTLLLLVSAFVGDNNWKNIYNHALQNNYRFLSYGDSSILL